MQPFPNKLVSILAGFLSLFIFLAFLSTCRSTLPPYISEIAPHPSPNPDSIPVIFVPGIKGSRLINEKGEILWLTGSQALGLSTPDLRLNPDSKILSREQSGSDSPKSQADKDFVRPFGPLARVTVIPYILDVAIYDGWLRRMSEEKGIDFYVFSYDWRRDNTVTRSLLLNYIKKISTQYKNKPVLIGHSMGGMLAFSVVNYNPDLVSHAVYVGVPFRGGIGYMRDLYKGVSTGLNREIQSPCMIARYESVYGFFPRLNSRDTKDVALDVEGKPIPIDFYDPKNWKKYSLGFYSNYCKPNEIPNPVEFERMLKMAKYFRQSLDPTPNLKRNPPLSLVITAKNRDTLEKIQIVPSLGGAGSEVVWDLDKAPKAPGDGRVTEANSLPPDGFSYKKVYTNYEHNVMLNDKKIQDAILDFLQSSRSSGEQN